MFGETLFTSLAGIKIEILVKCFYSFKSWNSWKILNISTFIVTYYILSCGYALYVQGYFYLISLYIQILVGMKYGM